MVHNEVNTQRAPNYKKAPNISYDRSSLTEDKMGPENCDVCDCMSFFEWLGCVACGVDW